MEDNFIIFEDNFIIFNDNKIISEVEFSSIRELQGILFSIICNASMLKIPIEMKLVDVLLKDRMK